MAPRLLINKKWSIIKNTINYRGDIRNQLEDSTMRIPLRIFRKYLSIGRIVVVPFLAEVERAHYKNDGEGGRSKVERQEI